MGLLKNPDAKKIEEMGFEDRLIAARNEELEESRTPVCSFAEFFADHEACKDSFDDGDETVVGSAVLIKCNEELPF